jgi:uncharacterized protein DUF6932
VLARLLGSDREILSEEYMPLPQLNNDGVLPAGTWDASLAEIEERFGLFQASDHRPRLFERLRDYLAEIKRWGHDAEVLIDGSFTSGKNAPGDIDLLLATDPNRDPGEEITPAERNVIDRTRVKRAYGFDVLSAPAGSRAHTNSKDYFAQDTRRPGLVKGIVRVSLDD